MTDQPKGRFARDVEEGRKVLPKQDAALTVQFFLKSGSIVSWRVPGDPSLFSLGAFVQSVRAQGYFLQADVYLPESEIAIISLMGVPSSARIVQSAPRAMQ